MPTLLENSDSLIGMAARREKALFLEYVLKDNNGNRVVNGQIHLEIQEHIALCKKHNEQYCGVLAPWGHGKTENAIIGNTLDEIGHNPNIRIFIISNTDDNAKARIESITNYISTDVDYHNVYPYVRPSQDQSSWTKHKFVVERESKAKDGTVEAYGVMTSGVGGRCDLLLFDDPVDMRNAIINPALREQVKQNIENVWLSRLTPDGMAIYIATVWHQDDATSCMLKNPKWKFLVMRISEDYESIECESPFKGKFKIPLWSYWNKDRLLNRLGVIGQRAFNRGFRQNALSDEDRTFPSSDKIFRHDVGVDSVSQYFPRICGIDPFGQAVVIYTIALNPQNHQRITVEIRRGKWQPRQTIAEIVNVFHKQHPVLMVVENNASQDAIIQWAHEVGGLDLPIVPFTTGAQKANIDFGLPSLEVEFANGAWMIPCRGIDFALDHENPIVVHANELRGHPVAVAADTVMAQWFAREGARFFTQHLQGGQVNPNEIVTAEEIGIERVTIGNY